MPDIPRLSNVEAVILGLLIGKGELYGLELVDESDGAVKRGTVYVTLGRMADKGLVESRAVKLEHERGLPRRLFRATGLGEIAYRANQRVQAIMLGATA